MAVLAALSGIAILLAPVYFRNLQLRSYLRETTPVSDEILRRDLLNQSRLLGLDLAPDHIQIHHSPAGSPADVQYVIRVSMPLYTVDLHFSSKVGEARK
ncbi:MAG TPA: hypothetical protein VMT32_05565 [Bryobacteraceae bacterium]|nr:hypothetical protein [Bryobacteraceae bacterium]